MNNGRDMSKEGMANLEVLKEDIQNIWNPQRFGILQNLRAEKPTPLGVG